MVLVIPKYLLSLHFNALAISLAKKIIELFTIIRSWGGQHIAVVGVKVTRAIFLPFSFHIFIWNKCLLSSRSSRRSTASMSGGWATRCRGCGESDKSHLELNRSWPETRVHGTVEETTKSSGKVTNLPKTKTTQTITSKANKIENKRGKIFLFLF